MNCEQFLRRRRSVMSIIQAANRLWHAGQRRTARELLILVAREMVSLDFAAFLPNSDQEAKFSSKLKSLLTRQLISSTEANSLRDLLCVQRSDDRAISIAINQVVERLSQLSVAFGEPIGPQPTVRWRMPAKEIASPPMVIERVKDQVDVNPPSPNVPKATIASEKQGFVPPRRRRFEPSAIVDVRTTHILRLAMALVLAGIGLRSVGAMYARMTFERMIFKSKRVAFPAALDERAKSKRMPLETKQTFSHAYSVLSSAVHGDRVSKPEVTTAIAKTYVFSRDAV